MEQHQNAGAQVGSYTISGSRATFQTEVSIRASNIGVSDVFEFSVEGDRLTMSGITGPFERQTLNFRKVG